MSKVSLQTQKSILYNKTCIVKTSGLSILYFVICYCQTFCPDLYTLEMRLMYDIDNL